MQFTELQVRTALVVGPQAVNDGSIINARGSKDGSGVVTQSHGKYFEAALRRKLFYSHAPSMAMTAPATGAVGNIVWNPPDSGILLALAKWSLCYQVADADALVCDLCYSVQATVPTTVTASTTGCCYLAALGIGGSQAKAYTTATIVTAGTPIYRLAFIPASVTALGSVQCEGDFEGGIIVPPGYLVTIHTAATAGTAGMSTTLWWEEVSV